MGGKATTTTDNSGAEEARLQEELAKQREDQQSQLDEASKKRLALLKRSLGASGSLIPGGSNSGQTLGG